MSALPDLVAIGNALVAQLASGAFDGNPINAGWNQPSGMVSPPCAVLVPPSPTFEALGEGFELPRTTWTVQLYTDGGGLGPDAQMEVAFLIAVLEALREDPSLGGAVNLATPVEAPEPPVQTSGSESATRRAYMRSLRINIDH